MASGQGGDADTAHTGDEPWWAGLGAAGGVLLALAGAALLLWSSLTGGADGEGWALSYGAGKVVAVGCVVAGGALLSRHRRRAAARRPDQGQDAEPTADR